eukprot:CAMPEP_0174902020 /NCGR_PEP_ID=MMETSP0167-20121228/36448_1 /TAXON_ID=38298 /ORGANISM="Rhodella maculata, Strain CCMP736" /LENGTH=242 /DNA_ID=CAMNT_0016143879 /DNA_START=70 /DNA_END=801 /DNA_ORIENTATION=-
MESKERSETQAFYDECADGYSAMMDDEVKKLYPDLAVMIESIQQLRLPPQHPKSAPKRVHDSSCGSGHVLAYLRDELRDRKRNDADFCEWVLSGSDLTPKFVEAASKKTQEDQQEHGGAPTSADGSISIWEADMITALDKHVGEFFGIVNTFAIHHITSEQVSQMLASHANALVRGGVLYLGFWEGEGLIDYGGSSDIVARLFSEATVDSLLKQAGFSEIVMKRSCFEQEMEMNSVYLIAKK